MNIDMKRFKWHKFHWFIIGVTLLKVILMGFFSSDYQNQMFMPFIQSFIDNIGGTYNPYEYYYMNNLVPSFPYPPLMLLIESIGGGLLHIVGQVPVFIANILFKLPNLVFDFVGMYYLMKLFPNRRRYVGILYFASPIILYAAYMHGQLDIIPTALLVGAIYYLNQSDKKAQYLSSIMLGLALATKLHIVAIIPIIFLYAVKRDGLKTSIKFIIIPLAITVLMIFPFLGEGIVQSVIFNNEQAVLSEVYLAFGNLKIYLPIIAVLFIYLKVFSIKSMNKELLISFCGILFTVFLALVPPMPGWYVWIVPFITVFFINFSENKYKNIIIYAALNGFYLLYFIFLHKTEYIDLYLLTQSLDILKVENQLIQNIVFTLLAGTLLYTTFLMYQLGITSNSFYKRRNLPFTIGITGDSGSGKTTSLHLLEGLLNRKNILFIEGDGDHRWERGHEGWKNYTHLNPKANHLYRQALDVEMLRSGASVNRVDYDHDTGKFSAEQKIKPNRYIVLCGLHSFYLPQMRKALDLKIYMDTDETLRRYWKIQRDTAHRGYTKEKIIEQIENRMGDAVKYIIPQKDYADLSIRYFDYKLENCFVNNHSVVISLQLTLSISVNLEPVIWELAKYGLKIEHDYSEDLQKQYIKIDGESLKHKDINFMYIANKTIPQLNEICYEPIKYEEGLNGIIQLFILILISYKMREEL